MVFVLLRHVIMHPQKYDTIILHFVLSTVVCVSVFISLLEFSFQFHLFLKQTTILLFSSLALHVLFNSLTHSLPRIREIKIIAINSL